MGPRPHAAPIQPSPSADGPQPYAVVVKESLLKSRAYNAPPPVPNNLSTVRNHNSRRISILQSMVLEHDLSLIGLFFYKL